MYDMQTPLPLKSEHFEEFCSVRIRFRTLLIRKKVDMKKFVYFLKNMITFFLFDLNETFRRF